MIKRDRERDGNGEILEEWRENRVTQDMRGKLLRTLRFER